MEFDGLSNRVIGCAQWLTYMKSAGVETGRLIDFNVTNLKDGIRRFVLQPFVLFVFFAVNRMRNAHPRLGFRRNNPNSRLAFDGVLFIIAATCGLSTGSFSACSPSWWWAPPCMSAG